MMVSGAVAVTISAYRYRQKPAAVGFAVLTLVLLYALVENIVEKPDGIAISALFILGIVVISLVSRISRTTELRVEHIEFDDAAREFIEASLAYDGGLHLIANKRQAGDEAEYAAKEAEQRAMNPVPGRADVLFLEVDIGDPSDFSDVLRVRGATIGDHRILRVASPAAPNAIAAVLLALRDATGVRPHAFFEWSEGSPGGTPAALPAPRPRRHPARCPGDHPQGRTRPATPPGHPRQLTGHGSRAVSAVSRVWPFSVLRSGATIAGR